MLVRKRIRSHELKIEEQFAGVRTNTGIALLYMDTIVNKGLLKEIKSRIDNFTINQFFV